jgi:hypothetical protein
MEIEINGESGVWHQPIASEAVAVQISPVSWRQAERFGDGLKEIE